MSSNAPFLASNPVQKHRPPGAQDRSQTKDRQAGAFGKIVHHPPVSSGAEDEMGDFVGAAKNVIAEMLWLIVRLLLVFHCLSSLWLLLNELALLRPPVPAAADMGVLAWTQA
jgi:hypothetical protein